MFFEKGKAEKLGKGGEKRVKRIFAILMACLFMIAVVAVMAMPAFAAPPERDKPGKGHPVETQSGNCPGGLNKDTSPGGLKKCD